MKLENGRPDYKVTEIEEKVYDCLDALHIQYTRVDHEPAYTMDVCGDIEATLKTPIYKNLFLTNAQNRYFFLVMPGDKKFKTKQITSQIESSRLSFGDENKMIEYLGCNPGSASLLGILFDKDLQVQLLIDEDILKSDYFGCHPCKNTSTLSIALEDLLNKFIPYTNHEITYVHLEKTNTES